MLFDLLFHLIIGCSLKRNTPKRRVADLWSATRLFGVLYAPDIFSYNNVTPMGF
jgi:hypothetical protein